MGFISQRLEKDAEALREMITCNNPADVMAIQSRWIEETLRDYTAEMTKLMTIYTKSVNDGPYPRLMLPGPDRLLASRWMRQSPSRSQGRLASGGCSRAVTRRLSEPG